MNKAQLLNKIEMNELEESLNQMVKYEKNVLEFMLPREGKMEIRLFLDTYKLSSYLLLVIISSDF